MFPNKGKFIFLFIMQGYNRALMEQGELKAFRKKWWHI